MKEGESKQYRDNLASEIKDIKNNVDKDLADQFLEAAQKTPEYQVARNEKVGEHKEQVKEKAKQEATSNIDTEKEAKIKAIKDKISAMNQENNVENLPNVERKLMESNEDFKNQLRVLLENNTDLANKFNSYYGFGEEGIKNIDESFRFNANSNGEFGNLESLFYGGRSNLFSGHTLSSVYKYEIDMSQVNLIYHNFEKMKENILQSLSKKLEKGQIFNELQNMHSEINKKSLNDKPVFVKKG